MTRLLVVGCGGTISSVRSGSSVDAGAGAVPTLDAAQLSASLAADLGMTGLSVEPTTHTHVASSAMSLADAVALAALARDWVDAAGTDAGGVVVTHGTDTLEEIAYAVDLLWTADVPVVFTGAMRPAGSPGADGPANLLAAARTALDPAARGQGVLVVLNDHVHLAATVVKTHTSDVATFASPGLGPIGWVAEGRVRLPLTRVNRWLLPGPVGDVDAHPVALLTAAVGDDGRLLDAVVAAGYRGIVIEALGGGHLPPAWAERFPLDVPVVLASRTGAGETLRSTYAFPGSEHDLLGRGLIPGGALTGPKVRVLLTLLLASGADAATITTAFTP